MVSLYVRKDSCYYQLRVYNKYAVNSKDKKFSIPTHVKVTNADIARFKAGIAERKKYKQLLESGTPKEKALAKVDRKLLKVKYTGTPELKRKINEIKKSFFDLKFELRTGVKIKSKKLFSMAMDEYLDEHTKKGNPHAYKSKTVTGYKSAKKHLINAASDKPIHEYTESNFDDLVAYMEDEDLSQNSKAIYCRNLNTFWNWCLTKNYAVQNIIKKIQPSEDDPEPIPLDDLRIILKYFKSNDKYQFDFIYLTLLTAARPSTIVVQKISWIDLGNDVIKMYNVKARKAKKFYRLPLYKVLKNHLLSMDINFDTENEDERIFKHYAFSEKSYTQSLKFWYRHIKYLAKKKDKKDPDKPVIRKKYLMKQLRPTFATYASEILKLSQAQIQAILHHSDSKTTEKYYIYAQLNQLKKDLDETKFLEDED